MTTSSLNGHPEIELIYDDGEPMESVWHREQMNLLIELTHTLWKARPDFFAGGNMFIYHSAEQARTRDFRGPDFFAVTGVDGDRQRKAWVVWEEGGRFPDIIVELMSPSTREEDLGPKKDLYERRFRTAEYFCVDPENGTLRGWRLLGTRYEPLLPGEAGGLESRILGATIGMRAGVVKRCRGNWARLWTPAGELVLTQEERAEVEHERAEREMRRAALAQEAGRIVSTFLRRGAGAAAAELRRLGDAERAELLAAIEGIDAHVASALQSFPSVVHDHGGVRSGKRKAKVAPRGRR